MVFLCERGILDAPDEGHAGGRGQDDAEQQNDNGISGIAIQPAENPNSDEKSRHCALEQEPQITRMNLLAKQIKRSSDQAQNTGEQERRTNRFACSQSREQQQSWDRETATPDSG